MNCVEEFKSKKELNEHLKHCYVDFKYPLCDTNLHVLNTIHMLKTHLNYCLPNSKINNNAIKIFLSSVNDFYQ